MSMTTYVEAIRKPDDRFREMLHVYQTCKDAGVDPPLEVIEYFDHEEPNPKGTRATLGPECCRSVNADMAEGYEVELALLPENTTHIRFVNSW